MTKAQELALNRMVERSRSAQEAIASARALGNAEEESKARTVRDEAGLELAALLGQLGGQADVDFRPMPDDFSREEITVDRFEDFDKDIQDRFYAQFTSRADAKSAIKGMTGPITYYRGPAQDDISLVATHPNSKRSRWHMPVEEFDALGTMDAPWDIHSAALAAGYSDARRRSIDKEARRLAEWRGTGTGARNEGRGGDLVDSAALKHTWSRDQAGRFLPRDTATFVELKKGMHIEAFRSTIARQVDDVDHRVLPGGITQHFVIAYDEQLAVTRQAQLGKSVALGATKKDDQEWRHTSGDHRLDAAADLQRRIDEANDRIQRCIQKRDVDGLRRAQQDLDHFLSEQRQGMGQTQPRGQTQGHGP